MTAQEAELLLKELVETNIVLARAIGREMEPAVAHEVFNNLLVIARKPSSTFQEWQSVVNMLRLVEGPYAIEALLSLSLSFAAMPTAEPYLKQAVARAITSIEMRCTDEHSLEIR